MLWLRDKGENELAILFCFLPYSCHDKFITLDCCLVWDWGRRGRDRMVVGTTYAISAYHHESCEFEPRSWRGVFDTTLCDNVCQWVL